MTLLASTRTRSTWLDSLISPDCTVLAISLEQESRGPLRWASGRYSILLPLWLPTSPNTLKPKIAQMELDLGGFFFKRRSALILYYPNIEQGHMCLVLCQIWLKRFISSYIEKEGSFTDVQRVYVGGSYVHVCMYMYSVCMYRARKVLSSLLTIIDCQLSEESKALKLRGGDGCYMQYTFEKVSRYWSKSYAVAWINCLSVHKGRLLKILKCSI